MSAIAERIAPQPQSAAAGVRSRGGQRVSVPWRLVVGAQYADAALSTYVKVAALAQRPKGCEARVETIAEYLGVSKSAAERGLRQLSRPDDVDQVTEVITTRRTYRGGRGQSAHRIVRPLRDGEAYVWLPVRAAEALTPRQLRAYAILTYAETRRIPLTAAELAEMLHHHSGASAGQHVDERTARRLMDDLDASGWITLDRRAGRQGRHAWTVHRSPLHSVPAAVGPDTDDGSGPEISDGSLASKEDQLTDSRSATAGGPIRRRRDQVVARGPVDNRVPVVGGAGDRALRADGGNRSSTFTTPTTSARPAYTGPGLQLSPRVWAVLAPVRHELPVLRPYVLREVARAVGRQLDSGTDLQRLHDRLQHRYATNTQAVRDVGRWLLGAGLPRRGRHPGCALGGCEAGVLWHSGEACPACEQLLAVDRQAKAQQQAPAAAPGVPPPAAAPPPVPRPSPRPVGPPGWCTCPGCRPVVRPA